MDFGKTGNRDCADLCDTGLFSFYVKDNTQGESINLISITVTVQSAETSAEVMLTHLAETPLFEKKIV